MGVESEGTGDALPQSTNERGLPPPKKKYIVFLFTLLKNAFSNIFQTKWTNSEKKLNFWGGGFGCPLPMNPSLPSKLCGDVLVPEVENQGF